MLFSTTCPSPVGDLFLVASDRGVRAILWPGEHDDLARRVAGIDGEMRDDPGNPHLVRAVSQLSEYFAGDRQQFDLDLDPVGTDFQQSVWNVLRTIPFGETMTYGQQASVIGDPKKARAVGAANGRNPLSIVVPCHRVIGADGSLTGFAAGLDAKRWLLDHERSASQPSLFA